MSSIGKIDASKCALQPAIIIHRICNNFLLKKSSLSAATFRRAILNAWSHQVDKTITNIKKQELTSLDVEVSASAARLLVDPNRVTANEEVNKIQKIDLSSSLSPQKEVLFLLPPILTSSKNHPDLLPDSIESINPTAVLHEEGPTSELENQLSFDNGDVYQGELKGGVREGFGTYFFGNGNRYVGEFKSGLRDGKGILIFKNGDIYDGSFESGLVHGWGTLIRPSEGKIFTTQHDKGKKVKQLIRLDITSETNIHVLLSNGARYVGDKFDGKFHGQGIYTFANGDVYKGNFFRGFFHGEGTLTTRYFSYSGNFEFHEIKGTGCYQNSEGENYKGSFRRGRRVGEGICHFSNGDIYKGYYKNGERSGEGCYTYKNGNTYVGEFDRDAFHGEGLFTYKLKGDHYKGAFKHGLFEGFGRYFYQNGDDFVGNYTKGKRCGYGVLTTSQGDRKKVHYKSDFDLEYDALRAKSADVICSTIILHADVEVSFAPKPKTKSTVCWVQRPFVDKVKHDINADNVEAIANKLHQKVYENHSEFRLLINKPSNLEKSLELLQNSIYGKFLLFKAPDREVENKNYINVKPKPTSQIDLGCTRYLYLYIDGVKESYIRRVYKIGRRFYPCGKEVAGEFRNGQLYRGYTLHNNQIEFKKPMIPFVVQERDRDILICNVNTQLFVIERRGDSDAYVYKMLYEEIEPLIYQALISTKTPSNTQYWYMEQVVHTLWWDKNHKPLLNYLNGVDEMTGSTRSTNLSSHGLELLRYLSHLDKLRK